MSKTCTLAILLLMSPPSLVHDETLTSPRGSSFLYGIPSARGGELSTLEAIPSAGVIEEVKLNAQMNRDHGGVLDAKGFKRLIDRARPIDVNDPIIQAWHYAPWYSGSFVVKEDTYHFSLYLGGLGTLITPTHKKGMFRFEHSPKEDRNGASTQTNGPTNRDGAATPVPGEGQQADGISEIKLMRRDGLAPPSKDVIVLRPERANSYATRRFQQLAQWLVSKGFFEMKNRYGGTEPTDCGGIALSAVRDGRRKIVFNYCGAGNAETWEIEMMIRGVDADIKRWRKEQEEG